MILMVLDNLLNQYFGFCRGLLWYLILLILIKITFRSGLKSNEGIGL
jgi:hypothetical protein